MTTDFVPYLSFDGQCEAAFTFYARALGGEIDMLMRWSDAPPEIGCTPETASRIMHVHLNVGGRGLMGSDAPPGRATKPQGFCVSFQVDDAAQAEHAFAALCEGASITMPMGPTFFAERFGMLTDKFGIPWMVNCPKAAG